MTKKGLSNSDVQRAEAYRASLIGAEGLGCRLLWAYVGPVPAQYLEAPYQPVATKAWFIQRGSVRLRQYAGDTHARAGQWFFPGDECGWQSFSSDARIVSIHYVVAWADGTPLCAHDRPLAFDAADHPVLARRAKALVTASVGIADVPRLDRKPFAPAPADHFRLQQHLHGWLAEYSQTMERLGYAPQMRPKQESTIADVLDWVDAHPLNKPLRERDVAARFDMTVARLNRLFVQAVRATPSKRFDARRREYAVTAIEYGQEQMKSIALKLGFSSPPHFTRWFRRQTGKSPTDYRIERERAG
ncbi:MAG TPA: AraC family transcriptional regulator [Tepidisphaeraceae bacterium]|jgi:AraC-like DNA-binding protein|nr:AraC family transcriptional regulator [Tepidisphaeraceae bacterium]